MASHERAGTIFEVLESHILRNRPSGKPEDAARRAARDLVKLLEASENAALLQKPFAVLVSSSSGGPTATITAIAPPQGNSSTELAATVAAAGQLVQQCMKHASTFDVAFLDAMWGRQEQSYYAHFADLKLVAALAQLAVWLQQTPETLWATPQQQQQPGEDSSGGNSSSKTQQQQQLLKGEYMHAEAVQLWWLCHRSLSQVFMDLFMADDDRGDENVRRFSTQLSDSGWVAAAAATLTWLQDKQPPLWMECCLSISGLMADLLHSWTNDRRQHTPVEMLTVLPNILQQSQRCLDTLVARAAAAGAGNRKPGKEGATGCSKDYINKTSTAERRLLSSMLQLQVYIIEVGAMVSVTSGRRNKVVTELVVSDAFAAAAGQLLAAACHQMYQQQQKQRSKAAAGTEAGAAGPNSSSSRQCLVPSKKQQASTLNIAACHMHYPFELQQPAQLWQQQHAEVLRNTLLSVMRAQHAMYGDCEPEDMVLMSQIALHQHITAISASMLNSSSSSSSSVSPALTAAAVQLTLEMCWLSAVAAEKEQQDRRFRSRKSDWEYGPMQGPKPCIPYKDLGEQSFQLLHMQLTAADNNARDRVTSQSAHEILSLLTLMAQSGRGSSAGDSTDLSFMMYTPGFLMGTVWAIGWHRGPQDTASADAGSSAEVSFFQWQLGQRLAAFKAVDPDWHTDNEVNPLHDFGKKAELTAFVADAPQAMLFQLASSQPVLYFSLIDCCVRQDTATAHAVMAAQLIRQGCWGTLGRPLKHGGADTSTQGLGPHTQVVGQSCSTEVANISGVQAAGVQSLDPGGSLLYDPAGVLALGSAVASMIKTWLVGFNKQRGSAAAADGGNFCLGIVQRLIRVGLLEVAESLLLAVQQHKPGSSSCVGSIQAMASSVLLLLVLSRSTLQLADALQAAAADQGGSGSGGGGGGPAAASEATARDKRESSPKIVWQYCEGLLQQAALRCGKVLRTLQHMQAASGTTAGSRADSSNSSSEAEVAWGYLLKLLQWHQQQGTAAGSTPSTAAEAEVEDALQALRDLLGKLPLPELCNNVCCVVMSGVSEVAAARKRCGGCKISRYCSAECQQQHWQQHKVVCGQVKAARAAGLPV